MKMTFEPYTLSIKNASAYFGVAEQTFYQWVSEGALCRGIHYLKLGRKTLIVREAFVEWLREQDGSMVFQTKSVASCNEARERRLHCRKPES
jgi:excisionase family DNA binding protein